MSARHRNEASARNVTGIVLAGGRARRMGGTDKGLIPLAGRPLAAHALDRLEPQVEAVLLNANRHADEYARLGARVVPDTIDGYAGPLAGLLAGLEAATSDLVVTAPCDSPFVPADLVARLRRGLEDARAELAVAHDGDRLQPVFMLVRRTLAGDLRAWLDGGGRKIDVWLADHRVAEVDFSDVPEAFRNINTSEERDEVESQLAAGERKP